MLFCYSDVNFDAPPLKYFIEANIENTLWKDVVDVNWKEEVDINVTFLQLHNTTKSAINEIADAMV